MNKNNKDSNHNLLNFGGPEITEDTKTRLNKNLYILESKINNALLSPTNISQNTLNEIENYLLATEKLLSEVEVDLAPYSLKTKEKYNLPRNKQLLTKLKNNFLELETYNNKKGFDLEDEDKKKLLNSNKLLDDAQIKMAESIKIINNVNNTDKNTMSSLKNQTNTIMNTANLLSEADSYIKKSGKVLNNMIRKAIANKAILIGIIILLGIIDILLLLHKIKNYTII